MQKTMIKSLLAVAVAATFATCANAAVPNDRNDWYTATGTMSGSIDPTKVRECQDFCVWGGYSRGSPTRLPFVVRPAWAISTG